jgi:D-alanine-D-alanine ligase
LSAPVRILQLVGSPTSEFFCELSELYARGSMDALRDPDAYAFVIAHVSPDATWRFPETLTVDALQHAATHTLAEAIAKITALGIDVALPQMFCERGMTDVRAMLELLAIPYLGNRPLQMALAADKAKAKAIVAAYGVLVARAEFARRGEPTGLAFPVVVKPNTSDNSAGVSLVTSASAYERAVETAFEHSETVLVEEFIALGREVRCGTVERHGEIVCLPLEEYFVDARTRPIRRAVDKLKRGDRDDLTLAAKTASESWIVPGDDPIVLAVWDAARRCHAALGCRQYGLFDFRIDPQGRPFFLEAGLYCSFSPQSVVVTMMEAAGTPLRRFFADAVEQLIAARAAI